tara:strand:+ start:111 stop:1004 length:894 start_codon:yes stop_codon:yes gene_type:complete
MRFSKTILKALIIASTLGISFSASAEEETFDIKSCPTADSGNNTIQYIQTSLNGACLHTPDKFEIVIYEMGLCPGTENPIKNDGASFDTSKCIKSMVSENGFKVDLAPGDSSAKTAALPQAETRPPSDTYNRAYIILSKDIKLKGSYAFKDGSVCVSTQGEFEDGYKYGKPDCTPGATAQDHFDDLNDMGDGRTWSGYMKATPMPTGGSVEALLVKADNTVAQNKDEVKKLVGLFKTAAATPVIITDNTSGLEMVLEVSVNEKGEGGSYMLQTNGDEEGLYLEGFGSAPFKPRFTTF